MVGRQVRSMHHLRLLAEQSLAGGRAEAETTRYALRAAESVLAQRLTELRGAFDTGTEQIGRASCRERVYSSV